MHFLVISTPSARRPSEVRESQRAFWDWLDPLVIGGTAKHVYTKLGRGAVIVFEVDSHETMHKLINQWAECVPATFQVEALLPREHQERIARAGTGPMAL
jgi:hypothetical protein